MPGARTAILSLSIQRATETPFSSSLKNSKTCHSEGGVCPRNLLFPRIFDKKQIPHFVRDDRFWKFFSKLSENFSPSSEPRKNDSALRLVLALLVFVAHFTIFVRLKEEHLAK